MEEVINVQEPINPDDFIESGNNRNSEISNKVEESQNDDIEKPKPTKKGRKCAIYAEGLGLKDLVEKYADSVKSEEDIETLLDRLMPAEVEGITKSNQKTRTTRLRKRLQEKLEKKKEEVGVETEDGEVEIIEKPKPDISSKKSKLINDIKILKASFGGDTTEDLSKLTEAELEKKLVNAANEAGDEAISSKLLNYSKLDIAKIAFKLIDSSIGAAEIVSPDKLYGLQEAHSKREEEITNVLRVIAKEHQELIMKKVTPTTVLAVIYGELLASVYLKNSLKGKDDKFES